MEKLWLLLGEVAMARVGLGRESGAGRMELRDIEAYAERTWILPVEAQG